MTIADYSMLTKKEPEKSQSHHAVNRGRSRRMVGVLKVDRVGARAGRVVVGEAEKMILMKGKVEVMIIRGMLKHSLQGEEGLRDIMHIEVGVNDLSDFCYGGLINLLACVHAVRLESIASLTPGQYATHAFPSR
jgi:hypothetical protein